MTADAVQRLAQFTKELPAEADAFWEEVAAGFKQLIAERTELVAAGKPAAPITVRFHAAVDQKDLPGELTLLPPMFPVRFAEVRRAVDHVTNCWRLGVPPDVVITDRRIETDRADVRHVHGFADRSGRHGSPGVMVTLAARWTQPTPADTWMTVVH